MATEMPLQLFKIVREMFEVVGIYPSQSSNRFWMQFNRRNLLVLLYLNAIGISSLAFLIWKASTVHEYGATFYMTVTMVGLTFSFLSIILESRNTFEIIGEIERIIVKSAFFIRENSLNRSKTRDRSSPWLILTKFSNSYKIFFFNLLSLIIGINERTSKTSVYFDVNRKIERMSEIMYFVYIQFTLLAIITSRLITTIANYYIYQLDDESFTLPMPIM